MIPNVRHAKRRKLETLQIIVRQRELVGGISVSIGDPNPWDSLEIVPYIFQIERSFTLAIEVPSPLSY